MTTIPGGVDPDVVSNFIAVVLRCLRVTVGVEAHVASARTPYNEQAAVAVAIDFQGDVRGPVTWLFPPSVALELVRRLMDEPEPAPDSAVDGAAELANILSGCATTVLEDAGFRSQMGPPRLHVGALPAGIRVRLASAAGPIDVIVSLAGRP